LTNHYARDVPWASSQAFVSAFRAKFGHDPTSLAAQGYDAARLLFDAIERTSGNITPEAIRAALASTRGFQGATGELSIDEDRNAQKPLVIETIEKGQFRYQATASTATLESGGGFAKSGATENAGSVSPAEPAKVPERTSRFSRALLT